MIRVIGIDPGVHTAVAVLVCGEFEQIWTRTFWDAYEIHRRIPYIDVDVVVIEVASDTYVWQQNARSRASVAKAMRVAQDVGAVRREGQLLAEGLRRADYDVKTAPPPGKLNAERFAKLTGYEGRTNQHERDAGLLAWNEYQAIKQRERISA